MPQLGVGAELEAEDVVEDVLEERHLPVDEVESHHTSHRLDRPRGRLLWVRHPQHRMTDLIRCWDYWSFLFREEPGYRLE